MASSPSFAVYDACVLYPFHLRNILIQCAFDGKTQLRPALDAIMRWLKGPPIEGDAPMGPARHNLGIHGLQTVSGRRDEAVLRNPVPGITYGGSAITHRLPASNWLRDEDEKVALIEAFEDPDLLSGVVDAPPRLALVMADLIRFKTSTLTEVGYRRNGVWNEETASQKTNTSD